MTQVSFIHCADTHLGKIQQNLAQRFEDFLDSFNDVVNYAVREKADFIIIAGDFFDKRNINPDTFSKTYGILEKLKQHNIPLIACEGNHDKTFYGNRLSWMETLAEIGYIILLKPEYDETGKIKYTAWSDENKKGFYYDINNRIRILGLGYLGPEADDRLCEITPFLSESKSNENKFNILLLHGIIKNYESDFIGNVSAKAVNNLKHCCDYIALGHQHKKYEHENFAFNPGSLEYWDIQEVRHKPCEKGFYHVKIDGSGKISSLFKASCKRHAVYLQVDVSGTKTPDDIESLIILKLANEIKNIDNINEPIIQVALKGTVTYDIMDIDTKSLKEKITEQFKPVLSDIDTGKIRFKGRGGSIISREMSREEIEKRVITDCIEQSGRFGGSEDKITSLISDIITLASAQASEEKNDEIYKMIIGSGIEKKKSEVKTDDEIIEDETWIEKTSEGGQKSMLDFE
jgi:DNA repair exonuclease SbcCD nuclease subunit